MSAWNDPDFKKLFLDHTPLIDVRAPVEFKAGHLPGSVNLPILNDEERHLIGTCYKQEGQAAAIELGHKLVSGQIKADRVQAWKTFIEENPRAQVFCFRGGLRSQLSCQWISEAGILRQPIPGGYKRMRQFFLSHLNDAPLPKIIRLGGLTGSGKTHLLLKLPQHLDIEGAGNHRGSSFGFLGEQPSQVTFENRLAFGLLKNPIQLILEDESATLGKLVIPPRLYKTMLSSPLVILQVSIEERVKNIFEDYVMNGQPDFFISATMRLNKYLGGSRTMALTTEIREAFQGDRTLERHTSWITTLLSDYYDIFYKRSLSKQKHLVVFEGDRSAIAAWWSGQL